MKRPLIDSIKKIDRRVLYWIVVFLLFYTILHFFYSGVYMPMFKLTGEGKIGQVLVEIRPLEKFLKEREPITLKDNPRQYGAFFLMVFYPILLLTQNPAVIEKILLFLAYLSLGLALYFTYRILDGKKKYAVLLLLFVLWMNFSSLYYIMAVKNVELWELALLCFALFSLLQKRSFLAGFSIAAATLIKLLPAIFFFYFLIKNRKALAYGLLSLLGILLVSHILFGPQVGLSYLPLVLAGGLKGDSWAVSHFENNGMKGMVYKLASGFQQDPAYPWVFLLQEEAKQMAFFLALAGQLAVLLLLGFLLWKHRHVQQKEIIWKEFGLVSATMLLLSPVSAMEYSTLLLLAFSIGLYFIFFEKTDVWQIILFVGSYLLIGHFVPFSIALQFFPSSFISNGLGLTVLEPSEIYKAIGMPFLGFLLLFLFFFRLLWKRKVKTMSD
ncbi:DUF2029 domain-containing protein [Candidatus Woesearchaeota archaeon]|nr:DUF2029 domain-containing protein [Candidatus Woesearchaeota archaeon]